jgi:hypothetical protein
MGKKQSKSQDGRRHRPSLPAPATTLQARYAADLAAFQAQHAAQRSPLIQAWGDFLRRVPWEWFLTLTFASRVHAEQAKKRIERWIHAIETNPARNHQGPCRWAVGWEYQQRHVLHAHMLLADVGAVPIFVALALWRRIGGGSARIDRYDPAKPGAYYIAKAGDIDLSESLVEDAPSAVSEAASTQPQPAPTTSSRRPKNRSDKVFEETVVAEFSLGSVNGVEFRAKVAVRSQELCVDIRKIRNGHPMPQGVQIPVPVAQQLFKQGPAISRAIAEYLRGHADQAVTSTTPRRPPR